MKKTFASILCIIASLALDACEDSSASKIENQIGKPCNIKTFTMTCVDGDVLYCDPDGTIQLSECHSSDSNKTCVTFDKKQSLEECNDEDDDCDATSSISAITCVDKANQCSQEGETITRCEKTPSSGSTYIREYTCEKTREGDLYYRQSDSTPCYGGYGVCNAKGTCDKPIHCETDAKYCDGNHLITCNANRQKIADCSAYTTPNVCTVIDGNAKCISEKEICNKEGEEKVTSCSTNTNKEHYKICHKAENGKLYYISEGSRACLDGCNEDKSACAPVACQDLNETVTQCRLQNGSTTYIDTYTCQANASGQKQLVLTQSDKCDNGYGSCSETGECIPAEACESKTFTSRCEDNVALTCVGKKIKHTYCENQSTPATCAVINGKASCYEEADKCTTPGEEIIVRCNASSGKLSLSICTESADGQYYYISFGTRACENGCNATGTNCE